MKRGLLSCVLFATALFGVAHAAPTITSFNPGSGPAGTLVTISGTNFSTTAASDTVKFNGTTAAVSTATATQLKATVPTGATSGPITVKVGTTTATSTVNYDVSIPGPTISSFSPSSGPAGATVSIVGTNFSSTPGSNVVKFNGTTAAVSSATTTQLTVTVPTGASTGAVTVKVGTQTATSGPSFSVTSTAPTIASFSPASGSVGASVTINGTNFSATPANNTVKFHGTAASVSSASPTQLTAIVAAGTTSGTVSVKVGAVTASSTASFTVVVPPVIDTFSPAGGAPGTTVVIDGNNFSPVKASNIVTFGGARATVDAATATQLTVTVPEDATTGAISVQISGHAATSQQSFVVDHVPVLTGFSPPSGPFGTDVTVSGSHLDSVLVVFIGDVAQEIVNSDEASLTIRIADGTLSGRIEATTDWTSGFSTEPFEVTTPMIYGFSPASGAVGSSVLIMGANFDPVRENNVVAFDGVAATVVDATDGQLTVIVPADATNGAISVSRNGNADVSDTAFTVLGIGVRPVQGPAGTRVTISGYGYFSANPASNVVTFNGVPAQVESATPQYLTVIVPAGATTGKVSVAANGTTATTASDYTVGPSFWFVFHPLSGPVGTHVTITCEFADASARDPSESISAFGAQPDAGGACPEFTVAVPRTFVTGPVTLSAGDERAVSATPFTVTTGPFKPIVSGFTQASDFVGTPIVFYGLFDSAGYGSINGTNSSYDDGLSADQCTSCQPRVSDTAHLDIPLGASTGTGVITGLRGYAAKTNAAIEVSAIPPPQVDAISPAFFAIGDIVTIRGKNFSDDAEENLVLLRADGDSALADVVYASGSELRIVVPPLPPAERAIAGIVSGGQSATFGLYVSGELVTSAVPAVKTIEPPVAHVGDEITISGQNFSAIAAENTVVFNAEEYGNSISVVPSQSSTTELKVIVPSGAISSEVRVASVPLTTMAESYLIIESPQAPTFSPHDGPSGSTVAVAVDNFDPNGYNSASIGGVSAHIVSATSSQVLLRVDSMATDGPVELLSNGIHMTAQGEFHAVPPVISSFSPASGAFGSSVTLNGSGFGLDELPHQVMFVGSSGSIAGDVLAGSNTQLTVRVPDFATSGPLQLALGGYADRGAPIRAQSGTAFTVTTAAPSIAAVSPLSGTADTNVVIEGVGFDPTPANDHVWLNGSAATVISATTTRLNFRVPAGATTGPVQVAVRTMLATSADEFTVQPMSISGFTPATGTLGTTVTINGANFGTFPLPTVLFNGHASTTVQVVGASSLTATVPNDATDGPLQIVVNGQSATSAGNFLVAPPPVITGFSPTSGYLGSTLTIIGENFSPEPTNNVVVFSGAGYRTTPLSASSTELRVVVRGESTSGPIQVSVGDDTHVVTSAQSFTVLSPSVSGLSPLSGALYSTVTITGEGFDAEFPGSNVVKFGGAAAVTDSATSTQLVVRVPSQATTGDVTVSIDDFPPMIAGSFTVLPEITGFNPTVGEVGTIVAVYGSRFSLTLAENAVAFNGVPAVVTGGNDFTLWTKVPVGATTGPITVSVAGITASSGAFFSVPSSGPSISGFDPSSGPAGTTVTVSGARFTTPASSNTVNFDGRPGAVASGTSTQLVAIVPSDAATGLIEVVDAAGHRGVSATNFTVTSSAPAISSFSPSSGPSGTLVTLVGTGFGATPAANTIWFNGVVAPAASASATQILVPVPPGATTGLVRVTAGGQTATSAMNFVVTTAPALSSFAPTSGPTGTAVVITGSHFATTTAANTVTFNGVQAVVTSASASQLVANVPSAASTGPIGVTVAGQSATTTTNFTVTADAPAIASFDPASATVGTQILIAGSNLVSAGASPTLTFNGGAAQINRATATEIVATVPAGATTGPIHIDVGGLGASSATDFNVVQPGTRASTLAFSLVPEPSIVDQAYTARVIVTGAASAPSGTIVVGNARSACAINLPATTCELAGEPDTGEVSVSAYYNGDATYATAYAAVDHYVNPATPTEICGFDPQAVPDDPSGFVPIEQMTGALYTPGLARDITGDGTLSVEITSPATGTSIADDTIEVAGTFIGPTNTGISVNGINGYTFDGHFVVPNVPLAVGSNVIEVTATTLPGAAASESIPVIHAGAPGPVALHPVQSAGFAPMTISFDFVVDALPNDAALASVAIDTNGDGVFDYTASTPAGLPHAFLYDTPGLYRATLKATDVHGIAYLAYRSVLIEDVARQRNMLCDVYGYLKNRLQAQDAANAALAYQPDVRSPYADAFTALAAGMPALAPQLGVIANGFIGEGFAELILVRDGTDQTRSGHPLRMTRGSDGVWRISEM